MHKLTGLSEGLDGDVFGLEHIVAKVHDVAEDVEVGVAHTHTHRLQ